MLKLGFALMPFQKFNSALASEFKQNTCKICAPQGKVTIQTCVLGLLPVYIEKIMYFPLQVNIFLINRIISGVILLNHMFNIFGNKSHQQFLKTEYEYLNTLSLDCRGGIMCQERINWNQICLEFRLAKDGIIKTVKA